MPRGNSSHLCTHLCLTSRRQICYRENVWGSAFALGIGCHILCEVRLIHNPLTLRPDNGKRVSWIAVLDASDRDVGDVSVVGKVTKDSFLPCTYLYASRERLLTPPSAHSRN